MLVLATSTGVAAQESASALPPDRPLTAPPEYAIDQWTTEDGLPQNSVNAIVQDPSGYLWVGTFGGLARFDGTSFTLMQRSDSAGRHIDRVLALAVGPDSALWIGTENGLLRRKDGEYRLYTTADGLPDNAVDALHVTGDGSVWLGTVRGGLAHLVGDGFRVFDEAAGMPIDHIISIVEDPDGRLWVNVAGGAVVMTVGEGGEPRWRAAPLEGAENMMLRDREGAYWFGVPDGLARWTDGSLRRYDTPSGWIMAEDPHGGYWVGTSNDGLFLVPAESEVAHRYPLPDARLGFRVRSAHVDLEGNVWVGTSANGLLRAKRNLFTTYTTAHGLSHDVATTVYEDGDGTVWVGTNCGGVNAIDPERGRVRTLNPRSSGDPLGDPCLFAFTRGPDGTLWQGTWGGGMTALPWDGRGERRRIAGLPGEVIRALFTDRDGTMWVGTHHGGVAAVREDRVRATYTTADGLAHNSIRTIHQTRDGALWIGTLEGLSRLADGRITTYTAADGLSAGHVRAIHEDRDGTLWIGTYGGGLNRLRDGEFIPITRADGLADDVVSAILEDDAGHFWMSGNRGIVRVARDELNAFADGRTRRVHSILYGRADGMLNPETNGGFQPAALRDSRGRLWFPTVEGVTVVDPARASPGGRPPSVAVEQVVVDGASQPPDEAVVVGPNRPNLEFRYTGLSLSAPQHVRFRYRLEGFEEAWVEAGTRRVAYYPRLPPGNYRFAVRAANRDGVWGQASSGLRLRVLPPFWSSWWFRLTAAAAGLVLLAAALRWRDAAVRRDQAAQEAFSRRLIESQEHERKRIAGELHDGLGQELLVVKNRALLALRSATLEPAARMQLDHISEVVSGSLASVRELAHNLTPHQLEHLGLSTAIRDMVRSVAETSGIPFDVEVQDIDALLTVEDGINLYRIVQEGLNNIVRHSDAASAELRIRRFDRVIRVTILDRGRGFQPERDGSGGIRGGFGLSGIARRIRLLDGRVEVISAPGSGTRIEASLPVAG